MEKGVDGATVAEAEVAEVEVPAKEEPRHAHIEMPRITEVGGRVADDCTRIGSPPSAQEVVFIVFDCPCICEDAASEAGYVVHVCRCHVGGWVPGLFGNARFR